MTPDALAPWLLTYLLHSTLLLGSAWLAVRLWRRMPVRAQERLWRSALLGGVLTASAQLAIGWEPWSGRLDLFAPSLAAGQAPAPPRASEVPLRPIEAPAVAPRSAPAADSLAPFAVQAPVRPSARAPVDPLALLGAVWLAAVGLLAVRALGARRGLRRRLRTRRPVSAPGMTRRLAALRAAAGLRRPVRLSETDALGSPVALGILRPEIIVPARAGTELSGAEQAAMLAHELGHHVRRDPLWLAVTRTLARVLCFQPLNFVAERHLRATGELLADAWAAQHTGRGRELATCLAKVAAWMLEGRPPRAVPAMAAAGSMLERRVARLLQDTRLPRRRAHACAWLAAVPLLLVAAWAPVVTAGAPPAPAPDTPATVGVPAPPGHGATSRARLDAEIAGLERELETLLDLLRRVADAPARMRSGAARLEAHLASLKQRRSALARAAKETR